MNKQTRPNSMHLAVEERSKFVFACYSSYSKAPLDDTSAEVGGDYGIALLALTKLLGAREKATAFY